MLGRCQWNWKVHTTGCHQLLSNRLPFPIRKEPLSPSTSTISIRVDIHESSFEAESLAWTKKDAEICLTFHIGPFNYELTRGLFEPEELRHLSVVDARGTTPSSLIEVSDDMPRRERHDTYTASLVEHSGVASFEEFVFLQHFVFTFDEQRKTLFWNPRIMERVLYRAFGTDPNMAKRRIQFGARSTQRTLKFATGNGKPLE